MNKIITLSLTILLFASCKKSSEIPNTSNAAAITTAYQYIKSLGYKDNQIVEKGNNYVVDGDMIFPKASLTLTTASGVPKTEQYSTSNVIGYNVQPDVKVRIDASMSSYVAEITGAIDMWNSVPNVRLHLSLTSSGDQQILVAAIAGFGDCGQSYVPKNGLPGSLVQIFIDQIYTYSFDQRQKVIAHELGHAIGFRHTNWQEIGDPINPVSSNGAYEGTMHLLGTPIDGSDVNSLMIQGNCGTGPTTLSSYDFVALQFLYPSTTPAPGSVPVFRYYSKTTTQDHFYTTNLSELGNGSNNGYIFEGIAFFAFTSPSQGALPIYRYNDASSGDHYYSTGYNEQLFYPQYTNEGIAFYSGGSGSVPVYRYWNGTAKDHFYTKNQSEAILGGGYVYEGIKFYAY